MALGDGGSAIKGTGLAGLIAQYRKEAIGRDYKLADDAPTVDALAQAIIEWFVANADVKVTELPGGTPVTPSEGEGYIE
jgi:hypothetical protein